MQSSRIVATRALLAASLVAFSNAAVAQDNSVTGSTVVNTAGAADTIDPTLNGSVATTATDPLLTETPPPVREEDNDFPWGLLGLLGLAGLLGLRKKEPDVHVDARRDTRP